MTDRARAKFDQVIGRLEGRPISERGSVSLIEVVEQRLRLLEVGRVEAFGEPAVDRGDQVAGFGLAALVAAQPGEARSSAQFPELGLLLLSDAPRNAPAAAGAGLCADAAPPPASAPRSFRRSATPRSNGPSPLQFALRSHMRWPARQCNGASTAPLRWRGKRSKRCAEAISPLPHRHF